MQDEFTQLNLVSAKWDWWGTKVINLSMIIHLLKGGSDVLLDRVIALLVNMWSSFIQKSGLSTVGLFSYKQGSHSDWETWKNGKAFSSQGKVREFWTDWKSQGKSHKILEKWENFRKILFDIFNDI